MAVGKYPGYNYFLSLVECESSENLQSYLIGFFLFLVHHFLHPLGTICSVPLVMDYILFNFFLFLIWTISSTLKH